jgi:hypothetical protein
VDGDATDAATSATDDGLADKPAAVTPAPSTALKKRGPVEIELEVSRQRSIAWTVGGSVLGVVLIMNLGTVGVWAGVALVAWAALHALNLVRTLVWPAGTIVVNEREVSLPRGPYRGKPVVVKPADVTAVYLLRKSVPWNTAAPVLVVELGAKAMVYPRDWFASEADQRHVVHALVKDPTKP